MPSNSAKQRRFMAAAAHNPRFAKKAGIKQSVAREFNQADQGALKLAVGGSVRRATGRAAAAAASQSTTPPPKGGGLRGALGRVVGRIAPQSQKNPQTLMSNHMLSGTDETLAETGDGLRNIVGRMSRGRIAAAKGGKIESSGPKRRLGYRNARVDISVHDGKGNYEVASVPRKRAPQEASKRYRYAEGGKVGTAMSALRALAKKYQSALESGDTVLARRLKKQLDSAGVKDPEEEVGNQKAATFAKGGKVKGVKSLVKMFRARMDDREGYIREGKGATKEEAYKKLREEVARDNGEDTVDALLKEHGVTYRGRE